MAQGCMAQSAPAVPYSFTVVSSSPAVDNTLDTTCIFNATGSLRDWMVLEEGSGEEYYGPVGLLIAKPQRINTWPSLIGEHQLSIRSNDIIDTHNPINH